MAEGAEVSSGVAEKVVHGLRLVALIEGVSFISLMCIAMPLKYFMNMPLAVRIAGSAHGFLFVLFCIALVAAWRFEERATPALLTKLFISSVIPFGMIWADRTIKAELPPRAETAAA